MFAAFLYSTSPRSWLVLLSVLPVACSTYAPKWERDIREPITPENWSLIWATTVKCLAHVIAVDRGGQLQTPLMVLSPLRISCINLSYMLLCFQGCQIVNSFHYICWDCPKVKIFGWFTKLYVYGYNVWQGHI